MAIDVLTRNNLQISGSGEQPMLFAHGFGCDQNMWRFVTPAFADRYKIVLFDYVGSGKSDLAAYDPQRYGSLDGYAQDVLDICEALDLREIIFVGHSVSSVIGTIAANRAPERFERLIFVGPSASYINDPPYIGGFERADIEGLLEMMDKNYLGWASFLAPAVMKNAERGELTAELEQSFCSTDPKIARRFAQITFLSDNRADFAKLKLHRIDSRQRGVGLGLAISRELAQAMGGNLSVTSEVGIGSVFTISLPKAEAPVETVAAAR